MPGPPPKSAATRQRRNARAELAVVEREDVDVFIPDPPAGLLKTTRDVWSAYWASKVARAVDLSSDGQLLERWIRAVDEYERVGKAFRKKRVVPGSMGQPVLNPLGSYLAQLKSELTRAENELGLTPMARLRLGITFGQARMTAQDLNRSIEQPQDDHAAEPTEQPAWEAEWEEA